MALIKDRPSVQNPLGTNFTSSSALDNLCKGFVNGCWRPCRSQVHQADKPRLSEEGTLAVVQTYLFPR